MSFIIIPRYVKRTFVQHFLVLGSVALIILIILNVRTSDELLRQNCNGCHDKRSQEAIKHTSAPYHEEQNTVEDRFTKRRQHLKDSCRNISLGKSVSDEAIQNHLIIDDKYKLVYCSIEKNGCTFWKRVFQILNGFKNVTNPFQTRGMAAYGGYKTAEKMTFYEISNILAHSTKFIFVRDPYERLLSGYVDKLFLPYAPYWFKLGKFIVQKFRHNGNSSAENCGDDVTFEEFVRYFLYSRKTNLKRDVHFSPNYEHCRPCEIGYDYIAKLETFKEDTLFLFKELKLNNTIQIKNFEKESERDAILDAIDWGFHVGERDDNCLTKEKVLLRIYKKLQIRGIISKDVPFPFSNTTTTKIDEYKQALLNAHAQSGPQEKRKINRREAFLQAYSSLPNDLLRELRKVLSIDAELFGYEAFPSILKVAEPTTFFYFGRGNA